MADTKVTHPDYPVREGDPELDRCVCGGVRHWHGASVAEGGEGCDDCDCPEFVYEFADGVQS
jgi:hypothetical protein